MQARRSLLVPLLIVVLVPIVVLVFALSVFRSRIGGLSELEARIKAKGEPLTVADLQAMYPAVPDEENGALLLIDAWAKEEPVYWDAFRRGATTLPARAEAPVDPIVPFLGSDANQFSRTNALSEEALAAAENFLSAREERMRLVRVAIARERSRFPIALSNGYDALLPHLAELRKDARTFRLESLLAIERGDADGAIDAIENEWRCCNMLETEPLLISQLVRVGLISEVLKSVEMMLGRRALSDAELKRLDALLGKMNTDGMLRTALLGERVMDLLVFERPASMLQSATSSTDSTGFRIGMGVLTATGLKAADRRLTLETLEQALVLADRKDPAMLAQFEGIIENAAMEARQFPPKIFSGMMLPALAKSPSRFFSGEARIRCARAAVAVERYRRANGESLPPALTNLVPRFLAEILLDPFDGQPLRFVTTPKGFIVYSIGPDGLDNGGAERMRSSMTSGFDETFVIER